MYFVSFFVIFLPVVLAEQECIHGNVFKQPPTNIEVNEGEDGVWTCILCPTFAGLKCTWYKYTEEGAIGNNVAYDFIGNQRHGNCSIKIKNSSVIRDDGKWTCGLPDTHSDNWSTPAIYTVLVEPKKIRITEIYSSTNGSQLECRSEGGNPAANLTWNLQNCPNIQVDGIENYMTGIKGINLTIFSVLRLTPIHESCYGKNLTCVSMWNHKNRKRSIVISNPRKTSSTDAKPHANPTTTPSSKPLEKTTRKNTGTTAKLHVNPTTTQSRKRFEKTTNRTTPINVKTVNTTPLSASPNENECDLPQNATESVSDKPNCNSSDNPPTIIYASIGAVSFILIGIGLGILLIKMHQKRKLASELDDHMTSTARYSPCLNTYARQASIIKVDEEVDSAQNVVYSIPKFLQQSKPDAIPSPPDDHVHSSPQPSLNYAEMDFKVHTNV